MDTAAVVTFLRARWSEEEVEGLEHEEEADVQRVLLDGEARRGVLSEVLRLPDPEPALAWLTLPHLHHRDCDPSWLPSGRTPTRRPAPER